METLNIVEAASPEEFVKIMNEQKEKDDYWLAWFYGGFDAELGEGWCDDCVRTEPHIRK